LLTGRHRLLTEVDNKETGFLSRLQRVTSVAIHEPRSDEIGTLYELGIPVCPSGHRWHCDVGQKIPLAIDREHVSAAFLADIHTITMNAVYATINQEDVAQPWAQTALADKDITPAATQAVVHQRFGPKVVAYDPSDREANQRALDQGYTIVTGSQLSKAQWANVRNAAAALPAGRVTPSPKPFTPDGRAPITVENPTPAQARFIAYAQWMHRELGLGSLAVTLLSDSAWSFLAAYGAGHLYANARKVKLEADTQAVDELLLHEFAHAHASNHFSEAYHGAICRFGALLRRLPAYPDLELLGVPTPAESTTRLAELVCN
jgi:hypothetical protein